MFACVRACRTLAPERRGGAFADAGGAAPHGGANHRFTLTVVACCRPACSHCRHFVDTAWRPGFKLRQLDGSARDWLWGVEAAPAVGAAPAAGSGGAESASSAVAVSGAADAPERDAAARRAWEVRVMEGVVHATLQDAHGYVEGLSGAVIDAAVGAHPWWRAHRHQLAAR